MPDVRKFRYDGVTGDYFEKLLYKVFVSIDAHTTVGELAGLLRLDIQLVKDAVSAYCRLGQSPSSPPLPTPALRSLADPDGVRP